ncbi:copper homeostasis protein [Pricia antarctica]|uniref:PF03932 family protein CutC n=1 Tax=Pricia antarctica TaxID=641691 RepID=A0A1G7AHG7_9FLAO|nr:copper homeostasis protein CutC [Pricia antarctica]SDE14271.1 copper homeostasis protein [Pricia antarctica]
MLIEVCANSLQSAINAEKAGAHRIELCSELAVGGITPSYGLLKAIREKITIPVHVLIRPRSGDFTYSNGEFEIMKTDIETCINMGFKGIVSGVLKKDFTLDVERTKILIEASGDLSFTFHRAFDWVQHPLEALAKLESLGVDCILTSGQQNSAEEGIALLTELHQKAAVITIMPGGGIKPENITIFKDKGFGAAHLSGSKFVKTLPIHPKISMNSPSFLKDDEISVSKLETLQKIVNAVK